LGNFIKRFLENYKYLKNMAEQQLTLMEKIISLCKRRGFIFPGSEIYGGLSNTYDYGPLGVEMKNNIKKLWWKYFIQDREDMTGIDGGILLNPRLWEASGHLANFKDALVECKSCHHRFRPDKLPDPSKCPDCGGGLTNPKTFSGMFKTLVGPVEEDALTAYLRPETAGAIFANYKNVMQSMNLKLPFGIGQIGKAFRNEITAGQFIFRQLEFEQMEIEYFIAPDSDWNRIFKEWLAYIYGFADLIGLERPRFNNHEISAAERAFYSQRTIDIEYQFPWGFDELWAIAYRTDYDLFRHQEVSGENLTYFDEQTKKHYIPHVLEPTFGMDRSILAILVQSYTEEKLADGEERILLKLPPKVAPYQIAVFPLLKNKPELVKKVKEIYLLLKASFKCEFDDNGNIGKRYRRQDEIGTPFCVTIDFETLSDGRVTARDRDTMRQERVAIADLPEYFSGRLGLIR